MFWFVPQGVTALEKPLTITFLEFSGATIERPQCIDVASCSLQMKDWTVYLLLKKMGHNWPHLIRTDKMMTDTSESWLSTRCKRFRQFQFELISLGKGSFEFGGTGLCLCSFLSR